MNRPTNCGHQFESIAGQIICNYRSEQEGGYETGPVIRAYTWLQ